jgi:hypothetical protein
MSTDLMEQLANSLSAPASLPCPEPGVYPGTPVLDYHRWACASNSRLTKLLRSPAHLKAYLDEPDDDTNALTMGRAAHSAILEPEDFAMRESVRAHASASKLLAGEGDVEFSIVWDARYDEDDEKAVQRCKARLDKMSPVIAGGVIVDIKTCRSASPRDFERAIFDHGYHRQGALYLDAARAAGLDASHFVIIAVEKEPPYAVAVYRITEGAIEAGYEQIRPLLRTYAMCETLNEWPAFGDDVKDIAIPAYAWTQLDVRSPFDSEAA